MRIMGSSSSMAIIFLLTLLELCGLLQSAPLAPALYVFGDSLFDSGNNNLLPTAAKANYRPYGVNFVHGVTGRFTNNRTAADVIAEYLGLPYAPPVLGFRKLQTLTGLNYASGACGILPQTGSQFGKCLSLGEQILLFQKKIIELRSTTYLRRSIALRKYLSKSIFLFCVGSNDLINYYINSQTIPFFKNTRPSPQTFAQLLVDTLVHHFQTLYYLGARKMVMFEVGPIGCMPSLAKTYKHTGKCVEEANQLVLEFNKRLSSKLKYLTSTLHGSSFVLGRVNALVYDAIINPSKYSFTDTRDSCCTTLQNGTCIPFSQPCSNPNTYFFFDGFHVTDAANSIIATRCIHDSSICTPYTLKKLVLI